MAVDGQCEGPADPCIVERWFAVVEAVELDRKAGNTLDLEGSGITKQVSPIDRQFIHHRKVPALELLELHLLILDEGAPDGIEEGKSVA